MCVKVECGHGFGLENAQPGGLTRARGRWLSTAAAHRLLPWCCCAGGLATIAAPAAAGAVAAVHTQPGGMSPFDGDCVQLQVGAH